MPIANRFLSHITDKEYFYQLAVSFCPKCCLVQLDDVPKPQQMFSSDYAFISSTSKVMSVHFKNQAQEIIRFIKNRPKPFVVELGCNDGVMLKHLAFRKINHLGIEPAENVALIAQKNGVTVQNAFFNHQLAQKIIRQYGRADVICASNTMCSVENLDSAFLGFQSLLKPDGVIFFEDPYIYDIVCLASFDQIYDEHIYYFSAHAVLKIAQKYDLTLTDMQHQPFHGGSMRYYLKNISLSPKTSFKVRNYLRQEKELRLNQFSGYKKFNRRVKKNVLEIHTFLAGRKKQKQPVVGYGATSKSTTLLNYCRIGPDLLAYITDNSSTKIGKYTPGTHIPVKSRQAFLTDRPKFTLLLAWNHRREIFKKEFLYLNKGGKFITYFPKLKIWRKTKSGMS